MLSWLMTTLPCDGVVTEVIEHVDPLGHRSLLMTSTTTGVPAGVVAVSSRAPSTLTVTVAVELNPLFGSVMV